MLTGIVVTNAIVLLDLVEQYRDRGLSLQDAVIEGGRHRLRPILMTAFATMLALAPLAVTGGGGGVGGAFISAPLAIVVIGGLFTSTLLTLILVPVLYSLASRFTGPRTTRELDALLDAAEDRRFKPLGLRGGAESNGAGKRRYVATMTIEPEPGRQGDPRILEELAGRGIKVEAVDGTHKMRITVAGLDAESASEAGKRALKAVRRSVPKKGYVLGDVTAVTSAEEPPLSRSQVEPAAAPTT
jgi:hypothetical protein